MVGQTDKQTYTQLSILSYEHACDHICFIDHIFLIEYNHEPYCQTHAFRHPVWPEMGRWIVPKSGHQIFVNNAFALAFALAFAFAFALVIALALAIAIAIAVLIVHEV